MTKILSRDPGELKKLRIQVEKSAEILKKTYDIKPENKIGFAFDDAFVTIKITGDDIRRLTQDVLATTIYNLIVAAAQTANPKGSA